jgi:SAM-dependent methyltransferase
MPMTSSVNETPSWKRQCAFYRTAEVQRYNWLTSNPVIARAEARLLGSVPRLGRGTRMLEVGCGEGANLTALRRLGVHMDYVGFDYFEEKVRFCRDAHEGKNAFLIADARRPFSFRDGVFDLVLVRDVLHHLDAPARVTLVHESFRVLKPKGCLVVLEANTSNPINFVYALLLPHERLMLQTSTLKLREWLKEVAAPFVDDMECRMEEPSTFFRLLLHYRYGIPALGHLNAVAGLLETLRGWCARGLSGKRWAYSVVRMVKRS